MNIYSFLPFEKNENKNKHKSSICWYLQIVIMSVSVYPKQ